MHFTTKMAARANIAAAKGVVLDYRVTADEVYLTYATTRSANPPWSLSGGQPGSLNGVKVHRHDGSVENYDMCTRVRVVKGELIRTDHRDGRRVWRPGRASPFRHRT